MSHSMNLSERVRAWITSELDRTGKSRKDLATALKLAPSGITRLLAGEREASAEEMIRIAHFFGDPDAFLHLLMEDFPGYQLVKKADPQRRAKTDVEDQVAQMRESLGALGKPLADRLIYVLATQPGDETCDFYIEDRVLSRIQTPNGLRGTAGVVAIQASGDHMTPMVRSGDPVFLLPVDDWSEAIPCFVCESPALGLNGLRRAFIGLLTEANGEDGTIALHHLGNSKRWTLTHSDIGTLWRVATLSELFPL